MSLGQRLAIAAIDRYRARRLAAGRCVFTPTCSEYARIAIRRYGVLRGGAMTGKRLLRCHVGNLGVVDYPT